MRGAALVVLAGCGATQPATFEKHTLDTEFRAEGVAIFDVDRDGTNDLVTDQLWYRGPDFTPSEIRTPEVFDIYGYSDDVGAWGEDLDRDGWIDLVVAPYAADAMFWYRNPEGRDEHWTKYPIAPELSAGIEVPVFADLFGDGRRVMIMGVEAPGLLAWFEPAADPFAPWVMHPISEPGFAGSYHFAHGLGTGDVDGDGRTDVLTTSGWFEQTISPARWLFHPLALGPQPCSTMFARDLDGDRRPDLLCAHPHTYGFAWWQQQPDGTFVERAIDDTISQMHSLGLADLDGDGAPELISGKNYWAHFAGYGDDGDDDPAVLVYWTTAPDGAGGATFTRHDIDDDSGIGRTVTAGDVDGDGRPDLVVTNKKGLFYFPQR